MIAGVNQLPISEGGDPPCWAHLLDDARGDIVDRHDIEVLVRNFYRDAAMDDIEALVSLDKDRDFLTRGGVFTSDMIDAYIALKYEEVQRFRMTTHPVEFDMYYSA